MRKIKLKQAIAEVEKLPNEDGKSIIQLEESLRQESDEALIKAQEHRDLMKMRKRWSNWILAAILFITFCDFVIIFFLGFNLMHFESEWAIPTIVADSIIKIIGLATIIVKFLFNKSSFFYAKPD